MGWKPQDLRSSIVVRALTYLFVQVDLKKLARRTQQQAQTKANQGRACSSQTKDKEGPAKKRCWQEPIYSRQTPKKKMWPYPKPPEKAKLGPDSPSDRTVIRRLILLPDGIRKGKGGVLSLSPTGW